jgi:MFS family permease
MAESSDRRRSSLRALRHRDFALYFGGSLLSNSGTWFQNIAQVLLVYRLTHSSFWVGVVSFAQFAGILLLAPWTGAAADRMDRRSLILITQVSAAVISGVLVALVATGRGTLPVVIGLALLLGLTTAFSTPALQAMIPSLVPREDLGAAIAMNSVTFNLARALGPVLGAITVAQLGIPWAISVNALSYLLFAAVLLVMRPAEQGPPSVERPRLRDSIRIIRANQRLTTLLLVVAAVSISMDPVSTLTPAFATRLFDSPDTYAGYLIGAFGLGAVVASVVPIRVSTNPERHIARMLMLLGSGIVGLALMPTLVGAFATLAVAGFGYLSGQAGATTLLQLGVSDRERGRVMALWSVAFLGSRPFAGLMDGALATALGPRLATALMAIPTLGMAALLYVRAASWKTDTAPEMVTRLTP